MDASRVLEDFLNICLNSRSLWLSFGWSTIRNFSDGPVLSIGPSQKFQLEVIYFLR